MDLLFHILIAVLVFYTILCAGLFFTQRKLLYYPSMNLKDPHHYGLLDVDVVRLETEDDITITAWHIPPKHSHAVTLIYFHGNAGHIGDRAGKLQAFADLGMGVLAVSYRGYGSSGGTPTEEGLYEDARAAIRHLQSLEIPNEQIVLFGESLGSGIAIQMATEFPIFAAVLEAPYTSVANRAQELYPFVPAKLLLQDHFNSEAKIGQVTIPLFFFHGEKDTIMPVAHGKRLFEQANEPKEAIYYPQFGHSDFDSEVIAKDILAFIEKHQEQDKN